MSSASTELDNGQENDVVLYGPPFDHPFADLAIRTSDNTLFLVSKLSLEMASPILRERLASQNTNTESGCAIAGGRPVLILPYPASDMALLLSTVYPVDVEFPQELEHIASLLATAEALEMNRSAAIIRRSVPLNELIRSDPINAYFLVCRHGLSEEMRLAVGYSLGRTLRLHTLVFPGELVYQLYLYHRAWTQRSSSLVKALSTQYSRVCILSHEHESEQGWCSYNTLGRSGLSVCLSQLLEQPLAINRALLCITLGKEPSHRDRLGPNRKPAIIKPIAKKIDFDKLDAICLNVETSASQAFASLPSFQLPDSYAFLRDECISSEDQIHDEHNRSDADIILRSCDGVLFKSHKIMLSISSPFFRDMFSLPTDPQDETGSLHIVQMAEKAVVLESLLSVIVPMKVTIPATFPEYCLVLAAAQKFDMKYAIETLRAGSLTRTWVQSSPCSRYGIASRLHLRDEVVTAAKELLASPMTIEQYDKDLCYLSADALQLLLKYRTACQLSISTLGQNEGTLHDLLWRALGSPRDVDCRDKKTIGDRSVPGWLTMLSTVETGDHVGLERPLSPWTQKYFERAVATHTRPAVPTFTSSDLEPPSSLCSYCTFLAPVTVYHVLSKSLRERASRSVAFPSWD